MTRKREHLLGPQKKRERFDFSKKFSTFLEKGALYYVLRTVLA